MDVVLYHILRENTVRSVCGFQQLFAANAVDVSWLFAGMTVFDEVRFLSQELFHLLGSNISLFQPLITVISRCNSFKGMVRFSLNWHGVPE